MYRIYGKIKKYVHKEICSVYTIGSALSVGLFGMAYFLEIHQLYYFILVQVRLHSMYIIMYCVTYV